jgi:hypothetical protein
MSQPDARKIITVKCRLSYPWLDKPQPGEPGKMPKYGVALLFPAGTDKTPYLKAVAAAIEAKWPGKLADAKFLAGLHKPIREADDVLAKGYPEDTAFFLNARTNQQPGCVDRDLTPIPQEQIKEKFYPGCWVKASLNCYGFEAQGKKGPTFGLNNIQFIGDGERLDSRMAASEEFTADLSAEPADLAGLVG